MKKCGKCEIDKNDEEFCPSELKQNSGKCKKCKSEYYRLWLAFETPAQKEKGNHEKEQSKIIKRCNRCKIEKNGIEFSPCEYERKYGNCRDCVKITNQEYRNTKNDPDKIEQRQIRKLDKIEREKLDKSKKKCTKCKEIKDKDNFYKNIFWCKDCKKQYNKEHEQENKERSRKWYLENRDEILKNSKEYYWNNKEEMSKKAHNTYMRHREVRIKKAREYAIKNSEVRKKWVNLYEKNRRINDFQFRIKGCISSSISHYLGERGLSKNGLSTAKYLPYTLETLEEHLKSLYEPWMTKDNYGKYDHKSWDDNNQNTWKWNMDHIIPQSLFDYKSIEDEEFRKCWALSNLRPLSAKQNFFDGVYRTRHK